MTRRLTRHTHVAVLWLCGRLVVQRACCVLRVLGGLWGKALTISATEHAPHPTLAATRTSLRDTHNSALRALAAPLSDSSSRRQ